MSGRSRIASLAFVAAFFPTLLPAQEAVEQQTLARGVGAAAPKQPQAWMTADGTVDVVYAVGDEVRLSTSRDDGKNFLPAKENIRCPNLSAGMRRGPRVVRTGTAVVVTAIGGKQGKGRDGDVQAWRSSDDGATWSGPVRVNDAADSAREGLHGMTLAADGRVWCVWLDLRAKKTELYVSASGDDGATWSKNVCVYRSPDGSVCECCHPSIAPLGAKGVRVLFRNSLSGLRDMYALDLPQGDPQKATPAAKLGLGEWKLAACPMDGGMLAVGPAPSRGDPPSVTVWRREKQVYAAAGDGASDKEKEKLLGPGEQPWAAWTSAGPVFVWIKNRPGDLLFAPGPASPPAKLASNARDPVVVSHPSRANAVVFWEEKEGDSAGVFSKPIAP